VAIQDFELTADQLRAACDADTLGFETTAELPDLPASLGQDRALATIDFGLGMQTPGYNIYVAGPAGTGRKFTVLSRAREVASRRPAPDDWCYLYNFDDPRQPVSLALPAGRAPQFAREVEELVRTCKQDILRAFESEAYDNQKEQAVGDVQTERSRLLRQLEERARSQGFMIQPTPMGLVTVPLADGRPMPREQFDQLPVEERQAIEAKMEQLREEIADTVSQARQLDKESRRRLEELDRQVAMTAVGPRFAELKARYQDQPNLLRHLDRMAEDIVSLRDELRAAEQAESPGQEAIPTRYHVNVLVTNDPTKGAPVIQEHSPTYYNLAGRLEYRPMQGAAATDFTLLKPGALHRANGGFLILQVLDVLLNPFAWEALKRALRSRELTIENIGEQYTPVPAAGLRSQPIPLDTKVILVGSPLLYYLLYQYDEDFGKLFKVRADFEVDMPGGREACRKYATFIATHCRQNHLRHLTKEAVSRVMEYGIRVAGDKDKLTTRFAAVADLLEEANHWADQDSADLITCAHVQHALEQKEYRSRRLEDRLFEFIARGDILLDVTGEKLAQVNGLAVLDLGDYSFGRPSRITAQVTPGRAGVLNIEREARLSGEIYNKAVMILTGYLTGRYATAAPLSLSATVCFEQSYEMIEGDSASCAELFAILSGLSGVPIHQGIAVTGSVDQNGNVQPIGGVNQKIEGFFAACKLKGLPAGRVEGLPASGGLSPSVGAHRCAPSGPSSCGGLPAGRVEGLPADCLAGDQGVIIPSQNVKNLMLKPEVTKAVEEGRFHIWAISHVDQGIEILTRLPAGSPDQADTIHGKAASRLRDFAEALKGKPEERTTHIIELPPGAVQPRPPGPPPPPVPPR
jgi:lon-related putative ATP-dependent protease